MVLLFANIRIVIHSSWLSFERICACHSPQYGTEWLIIDNFGVSVCLSVYRGVVNVVSRAVNAPNCLLAPEISQELRRLETADISNRRLSWWTICPWTCTLASAGKILEKLFDTECVCVCVCVLA